MKSPLERQKLVYLPKLKEVRAARTRAKVSVPDIAAAVGPNKWQVGQMLGGNKVSKLLAEKIAAYFDMRIDELFIEIDLEDPDEAMAVQVPVASRGFSIAKFVRLFNVKSLNVLVG